MAGEDTYVGRDFSRFSLSSNVTRLAKLQEKEIKYNKGSQLADRGRKKKRRRRLFGQIANLL